MGTSCIDFSILGSEGGSATTRPLLSSSQEQSEPNTPICDPISDRRLTSPSQFDSGDQVTAIEEPEDKSKKPPEIILSVSNLDTQTTLEASDPSVSDRKSLKTLGSPSRSKVSPSPSRSMASDKGTSKITGKSVSGWL